MPLNAISFEFQRCASKKFCCECVWASVLIYIYTYSVSVCASGKMKFSRIIFTYTRCERLYICVCVCVLYSQSLWCPSHYLTVSACYTAELPFETIIKTTTHSYIESTYRFFFLFFHSIKQAENYIALRIGVRCCGGVIVVVVIFSNARF